MKNKQRAATKGFTHYGMECTNPPHHKGNVIAVKTCTVDITLLIDMCYKWTFCGKCIMAFSEDNT